MKNPGLEAFGAPTTTYQRPSSHPIWGDVNDDVDPDRLIDEDEEDASDFTRGVNFGRWRNPGHSIHVPVEVGRPFKPGETPEDVIHGEVITKEDHDSASRIVNGEHESDAESANPFVEEARQDLHTPASSEAVATMSGLLRGSSPEDVGGMDEAHDYLSRHFTGVRINPHRGTLLAHSPAGTQVARRHVHLPAIPEEPQQQTYSLTNKHGTFKSNDPHRLLRAMVAFQIVHNEIARHQQQKREEAEAKERDRLKSTSGIREVWDYLRPSTAPGAMPPKPKKSNPTPLDNVPASAVFEPGRGIDFNHERKPGGYVAPEADAPSNWHRDGQGTAYSPGHYMRMLLDPSESTKPRPDGLNPGHTFTYARNDATGHTIPRRSRSGGFDYWVNSLHPAVRGEGFDHPPEPPAPRPNPMPRARRRTPPMPPHDPPVRGLPSGGWPVVPQNLDEPEEGEGHRRESAVQVNDLCPVCASGYLEPYDAQYHECLNCGSLVNHVGMEKEGASRRKPGGLGRGLGQIQEYQGDPLNLGTGGSENPENVVDLDETMAHHPLAGEENQNPDEVYEAPRRILGGYEPDELDEHMGKLGFSPIHKPGALRVYAMPDPDIEGAYYRLTEGSPKRDGSHSGWALTADHISSREGWQQGGEPFKGRSISIERMTKDPAAMKEIRQPLPDLQNRVMGDKSILATGHHPIEDDALNRAIRDVSRHGRNSQTYRNIFNLDYYPTRPPEPAVGKTQRDLRHLSSVGNPGLTRFMG